jgi:DNA-binding LytR/AlgR family response regulator
MTGMPDYMIMIHQSFACNINKVKSFSKEEGITVSDGACIPVSRRHYKSVKESIALHI